MTDLEHGSLLCMDAMLYGMGLRDQTSMRANPLSACRPGAGCCARAAAAGMLSQSVR